MTPDCEKDRLSAIQWAYATMALKPVFLDTETTGLDDEAEICDIAVVDWDGVVLFDTLVKPAHPIPTEASNVHGITDEMVADAPMFGDISHRLSVLLHRRPIIIYNAAFDRRLLKQSAKAAGSAVDWTAGQNAACAMNYYAEYYGDWNDYHQSYRWVKLGNAAIQCGVTIPSGLHRARVDAELTRQVVRYMAGQAKTDS